MTSEKEENESVKQGQERLAEIGRILYSGIKRLKGRECSKNSLYQLDYTLPKSVHNEVFNKNR
jgi:DNA helicase IV